MITGAENVGRTRHDAIPKLLTSSEAADILRCSEKTILRRVKAGTLTAFKEGGRYLFDAEVIRATLLARIVRPKTKSSNTFSLGSASCDVSDPSY